MRNYNQIELSLERICEQGCRSVNQIIQKIENGELNGELVELIMHLNDSQQQIILTELKSIMAVYGKTGSCELK